jgi:hypothetical protein
MPPAAPHPLGTNAVEDHFSGPIEPRRARTRRTRERRSRCTRHRRAKRPGADAATAFPTVAGATDGAQRAAAWDEHRASWPARGQLLLMVGSSHLVAEEARECSRRIPITPSPVPLVIASGMTRVRHHASAVSGEPRSLTGFSSRALRGGRCTRDEARRSSEGFRADRRRPRRPSGRLASCSHRSSVPTAHTSNSWPSGSGTPGRARATSTGARISDFTTAIPTSDRPPLTP